ncbi:glycosyltransferase family 2 protein [Actinacidiphila bryophytorum]|uniref:Glycosyltransferase involved in cell wall bisynthesis n=1 Tax=Actinacidiphila bryophytorum TaxID=1436133 RepID=A0A9W4GZI0_9ACTN|nr:glycosyltransferase family 2 protein [Actinacidiphila bryophytorum]MBM9434527.1 glycosyltransferase family 2 protein [Actinacidiphila bryophytorum]MBN6542743.1 glycosyltransferase family 2 protein [Actinacidiphila bryophytorum]CAG7627063.1 Glycosyltransferase involved in cell wall bisynthesis [Actinacidiphila bryophytorum]
MGRVSVVVVVYNDAERLPTAVQSALDQTLPDVDVVIVDDHSPDRSFEVAQELSAAQPGRVSAYRLAENSGSGGGPRNRGMAEATGDYVMFLDSDDVLPPTAAEVLLRAAQEHGAEVATGKAVRRELPAGRTTVWAPGLYDTDAGAVLPGSVLHGIGAHPEMLMDTLVVNKLYRRDFLKRTGLAFPSGMLYEDFVFTGRLYAAQPVMAVIADPVYVWHVRRAAASLSVSLHRAVIENWRDRVAAHGLVVEDLRSAGLGELAEEAQAKFVDYDLPMYLRELPQRSAEYRAAWWRITREHLAGFAASAFPRAKAPYRWLVRSVMALPEPPAPALLGRLVELAAAPPRLVPPYDGDRDRPLLGDGPTAVPLDGLAALPAEELPVTVEGTVTAGATVRVSLLLHELYGRLAELDPRTVRVELTERSGLRPPLVAHAPLSAVNGGWAAEVAFPAGGLGSPRQLTSWSMRAEIGHADGSASTTEVRAAEAQRRRRDTVLLPPGRVLLVRTHVSERRALMLRCAGGLAGARRAAGSVRRRLAGR